VAGCLLRDLIPAILNNFMKRNRDTVKVEAVCKLCDLIPEIVNYFMKRPQ
jgi:hypothetical protein